MYTQKLTSSKDVRLRDTSVLTTLTSTFNYTCFNRSRLNTTGTLLVQLPSQELVCLVLRESSVNNAQVLAVVGDLVPITIYVLKITRKVSERSLKDLALNIGIQMRLHLDVLLVRSSRVGDHVIGSLFNSAHKLFNLFRVVLDKVFITDIKNLQEEKD